MSKTFTKTEVAAEVTRVKNGELPREQSAVYAEWLKLEDSWREQLDPDDIVTFDEVDVDDIVVYFHLADLLNPSLSSEEYDGICAGSDNQVVQDDEPESDDSEINLVDAVYAGVMAASLPYESGKADQQKDYIPILAGALIEKGLTQTQAEDMIDLLNEVISRIEDGEGNRSDDPVTDVEPEEEELTEQEFMNEETT